MLVQLSSADWQKKWILQIKTDARGRIDLNFAFEALVRRNLPYIEYISFYTARGWNRWVIPDRVVQWSTPWEAFLWRPIKVPFVCGFSPSLCMITLNPQPFCSFSSHKYNNYDKATYIVSSNLCLFTYPQATGFPWNPYPLTEAY